MGGDAHLSENTVKTASIAVSSSAVVTTYEAVYGHAVYSRGDDMVKEVGRSISNFVRYSDLPGLAASFATTVTVGGPAPLHVKFAFHNFH